MSFGDAIGECFFNYANFRDRAARAEYWWWVLFSTVLLLVALVLDFFIFRGWAVGPFYLVISLAALLPGLTVTVRRLHDTGRSGWWIMLPIVTGILTVFASGYVEATSRGEPTPMELALIGVPALLVLATSILLFVWMLLPSNPGNNRYGPNRYTR